MALPWFRHWRGLMTDPKFKTIARLSGEPLVYVLGVYNILLESACDATERGVTTCDADDVASALDIETSSVIAILDAMQEKVLDGKLLTGWESRQPIKEDSSTERTQKYRAKLKERLVTPCDAPEENRFIGDSESIGVTTSLPPSATRKAELPTLEQVQKRFDEIGRPECAQRFYENYAAVGWKDAQKRPITDWTLKVGAWVERQNDKITTEPISSTRGSPRNTKENLTFEQLVVREAEKREARERTARGVLT